MSMLKKNSAAFAFAMALVLSGTAQSQTSERCAMPVATIFSISGDASGVRITFGAAGVVTIDTFTFALCEGDRLEVGEYSHVTLFLIEPQTYINVDSSSEMYFPPREGPWYLELIRGLFHILTDSELEVRTPFLTAGVEGTEFLVEALPTGARVDVLNGTVRVTNLDDPADFLDLSVAPGLAAAERVAGQPLERIVVRPRNAVQWAMYHPTAPLALQGGAGPLAASVEAYRNGNATEALTLMDAADVSSDDETFALYRAQLLLAVGDPDEALRLLGPAEDPVLSSREAWGIRALIAVVQNETGSALEFAERALNPEEDASPVSPAALVSASYAQQANFELEAARDSLESAIALDADDNDSLARARLAEILLMLGHVGEAIEQAELARTGASGPDLARADTALGFARLAEIDLDAARDAFEAAIELEPESSLAWFGLGLTKIRDGDLREGREDIQRARSLGPNDPLIRSYLGKAYFEERENALAATELRAAKELDPNDPTPYFYDAIRKQTTNRPVEALLDLQRSIELNDNRAVYRSRFLLDDDVAARSSGLARIYRDLGFERLALMEGWKSVEADPSNYSGHRFLADIYSTQPRHEIARVSELLQAQLLQPLNTTPLQPQLGVSDLLVLAGTGPSDTAFNEFHPLFARDGINVQANGIGGGDGILGDDLVVSAIYRSLSMSAGQFHYETDGFRENADLTQDIYNVFLQGRLGTRTSVQGEFRSRELERGDRLLRFDPDNFKSNERQTEDSDMSRFGIHHALSPNSDLIGSVIYRTKGATLRDVAFEFPVEIDSEEDGYIAEFQHLFRHERFSVIGGVGHYSAERTDDELFFFPPSTTTVTETEHTNAYVYSTFEFPARIVWTLGVSGDFVDVSPVGGPEESFDQANPKAGVSWDILPGTRLRAAFFRVQERDLLADMTVEPTHVAGFNQFFQDATRSDSWQYGVGLDQKFTESFFAGVEATKRQLDVPGEIINSSVESGNFAWDEVGARAFSYWAPHPWLALTADLHFEKLRRPGEFAGDELFTRLRTYKVPLGVGFFHPSGFSAEFLLTGIDQSGHFSDNGVVYVPDESAFWAADAAFGYRFPERRGLASVSVKNLFDNNFRFQDSDPRNPRISPNRLVVFRLSVAF